MERRATDGVLLVDKPAGVSSHDVVSVARRALRDKGRLVIPSACS